MQSIETEAAKRRSELDRPLEGIHTECTSSRGLPVVDTVFGGILATSTVGVLATPEESFNSLPGEKAGATLALLGASMLYFVGAMYGFEATSECIAFKKRVH